MEFDIDKYFPEVSKAGEASFEDIRPLYLAASKQFLDHYREEIKARHRAGAGGDWVVRSITAMSDTLIKKLFLSITKGLANYSHAREKLTLVAIGGYGRGELNPFSDIDLMFLHGGKDAQRIEDIAQKLLYFLWDMRLDVGYSVRNLTDCVEMANADTTVKTALLDGRFLVGSRTLFNDFQKVMVTQILAKRSDGFIKEKLDELKKRREKFGSSVYILEPNIKEGEGCLRDLHSAGRCQPDARIRPGTARLVRARAVGELRGS